MSVVNRIVLPAFLALGAALPFACTNSAPTGPLATYNLTATPTYTVTNTPTNWAGYTNTFTPTGTPHTATPTMTSTMTQTTTNTANLTWTATNTPTATLTVTMTVTMTTTMTSTPFSSPTPVVTASNWQVQNSLSPNGVAYDGTTVYVAAGNDSGTNGQIQLFSNSGSYISEFSSVSYSSTTYSFGLPNGVACANSTLYVIDQINDALYAVTNPSGTPALASAPLTSWSPASGGPSSFFGPQGVAVDGSGNVYVADTNNNAVEIFTGALSASQELTTGLYNPDAVAVNSAGTILVIADATSGSVTFNNQISVYSNPGTGFVSPSSFMIPSADITGLTLDSSGNIYVADSGNGLVEVYTLTGSLETEGLGLTNTYPVSPDGLVFINNNLLVSDYSNNQLYLIYP